MCIRDRRITGTARPLPAIKAQDGTPDWNLIERLLKEWQPDEIIVGLPLNMDGTEQPLTARARKFANRIHGDVYKRQPLPHGALSESRFR